MVYPRVGGGMGRAVLTTGKHDVLLRYSNFRDGVRACMQVERKGTMHWKSFMTGI